MHLKFTKNWATHSGKFYDYSTIQILREISFGGSRSCKIANFAYKWQNLHFKNLQNWFHVKSEWQKNHEVFTLCFYLIILLLGVHNYGNILQLFWGTNLAYYVRKTVFNLKTFTFQNYRAVWGLLSFMVWLNIHFLLLRIFQTFRVLLKWYVQGYFLLIMSVTFLNTKITWNHGKLVPNLNPIYWKSKGIIILII